MIYSPTGMRVLLQNPKYIGLAHGLSDFCPPIVDTQTFDAVNRIVTQRGERTDQTKTDRVYLFRSLVFCAECGNRLSAHTVARKYIYYRCSKYEKLHLCVHKKRTSELILEQWLLSNLLESALTHNTKILTQNVKKHSENDESKILRKMEKLKDLYLSDLIDRTVYEQDYTQLRNTLLNIQTPEPILSPINISALTSCIESYEYLDSAHKKAFWARVIKSITIANDDTFCVDLVSP